MAERRAEIAALGRIRRVVVKIGSSVLANESGLAASELSRLAGEIGALKESGLSVTVVSSGAIAAGRTVLGGGRPRTIPQRQAAASVGQIRLMAEWDRAFSAQGITVAQILLDAEDLASRHRYLNAEHAISALHRGGVLPIVNENDTVAVDELKFGDNDNLSALVATLVGADLLVLLSDVPGLFESDPRIDPEAALISALHRIDNKVLAHAGDGSNPLGTGGMRSKLLAAKKAAHAGIASVIADGREAGTLARVLDPGQNEGTLILPSADPVARRKHWIAFSMKPRGSLQCDEGATTAVRRRGRSLLPSGVTAVEGKFRRGDCISLVDAAGDEFARGLAVYGAEEASLIAGKRSQQVGGILGYELGAELVHRNDLVLLDGDAPVDPKKKKR
ncbi:MAG: glutamate 5-kinase [Candidatus Binatia bacterium]|nr:glutamate 5-kinase [Candidatus Binatia bacterium]